MESLRQRTALISRAKRKPSASLPLSEKVASTISATTQPIFRYGKLPVRLWSPEPRRVLYRQLRKKLPGLIALNVRHRTIWPYFLALRPHQWLKNGLIILPAIAAHAFSVNELFAVLIAVLSFSFGASCVYLINDMIDLPHDRAHPKKRHRALAAGVIPLSHAILIASVAAILSFALAFMLPAAFMVILAAYIGSSITYSLYLKRKLMIDVVALAGLYGIRVLAGGAATGIVLSHWLVGFCFFIFLSLALVKRMAEMIALPPATSGQYQRSRLSPRRSSDDRRSRRCLWACGCACACALHQLD